MDKIDEEALVYTLLRYDAAALSAGSWWSLGRMVQGAYRQSPADAPQDIHCLWAKASAMQG